MSDGAGYSYALTRLTRGRDRRVIVATVDLPLRYLVLGLVAAVPALILTIIGWLFVGEYALALILVVEAAAFWLYESRSSVGLKQRQYQRINDRRRAKQRENLFFCCGKVVDPLTQTQVQLVSNTAPARPAATPTNPRVPFTVPPDAPAVTAKTAGRRRAEGGRRAQRGTPRQLTPATATTSTAPEPVGAASSRGAARNPPPLDGLPGVRRAG